MKIAIFCEDRFKNNKQFDTSIDANLAPYKRVQDILGKENCITYDLLEGRKDKDEFIIITRLALNIFSLKKFFKLLIQYRNKKYLFLKEPPVVAKFQYYALFHAFFDRIYTWNDRLVDHKKYYKLTRQQSDQGLETPHIDRKRKKLCMLINGNKYSYGKSELYSERVKAIRFFEAYSPENFDLYGTKRDTPNFHQRIFGFSKFPSYQGKVDNKFLTLSQYKFNICFENMNNIDGYITEKIWDSFKAKSVPIYLGAENIETYIPKSTFIDFRDYDKDYKKLFSYLSSMSKGEHEEYINHAQAFLISDEAKKRFGEVRAEDFIASLL